MESSKKETPPCSSDPAACNPAGFVRPTVADPDPDTYTEYNWPRFLVIKSCDNKCITKHNLFVIAKAIEGIAGKPKNTRTLKNAGLLLIELEHKHHSINLLKTKLLHDIPVEISVHRSMNSSKGVITCPDYHHMDDAVILDQLKQSDQNVKDVYRITTYRNGKKTETSTFVVTFSTPKIPEKMYVGHHRVNVRTYIPNPRRCTNCHQFKHTKNFCKNDAACDKCGQVGHEENICTNEVNCTNCKGPHKSSSRECPVWKSEKAIVKYKYDNDVSFYEARNKVEEQEKLLKSTKISSYSSVVSGSVSKSERGTQTDLTWPQHLTSPILTTVSLSSNDQAVQSTEMDSESANTKRSRNDSSSNDEDVSSDSNKNK